ncbi:MAG: HDIG domain-containing protein [Anaerolineales bacterium]|nr:HDIG domain-containing protein [Anaerolineales bacterium]
MTAHPVPRPSSTGRWLIVWVVTAASVLLAAGLLALPFQTLNTLALRAGEPAGQDILAPQSLTFTSDLQTAAAREAAAAAVAEVYDPPDSRTARQQVLLLREALAYIETVRADTLAESAQRRADLRAIRDVPLEPDIADLILSFDASRWAIVRTEALAILEQGMRSSIRADQITEVRGSLLLRVSVDLSEDQSRVVLALVSPLIVPNSFYNESATQAARAAAAEAVEPVVKQIVRGQTVVTRGRVITEVDLETLRMLGLLQPEFNWQQTASAVLAVLITGLLVVVYARRFHPEIGRDPKRVLLMGLLFNAFLLTAQLLIPGRTVQPYFFPAAALSMLLTVLVGPNLAMTVSVAMGALAGYIGGGNLELTIYIALGGLVAAITLGRADRLDLFFWAGLASAVAGMGIILVFRLPSPATDLVGLAQLAAASLVNGGISAAVTLMALFALGGLFDVTTSLQLVEYSRPDHPLLRFVLRNAPGTYQHSLQIANLAEQAAERIGANAMLVRVGALYHDAGKALHPQYFVENQLDGVNIHNSLDPDTSAMVIIRHVADGLELARKHRLPTRLRDFIAEHHGTLMTMYQYRRAVEAAGGDAAKVDPARFTYPGPRPQSRESALLMLADGCEAKTRSDRPKTEDDIDRIVKGLMDDRLTKGQLDDTDLTLRDLHLIRASFVNTLRGVFHPRVQYPELTPAAPAPELAPPQASNDPAAPVHPN